MTYHNSEIAKQTDRLKVAAILDEFSYKCFQYDCDLIIFEPDNWQEIMSQDRPDLLLVESAWKGNGGSWQYKIGKYSNQDRRELKKLLQWCRENDVATVFWNKEDPIHFEKFIDSAALFDYVFTSDENMIEEYQGRLNHNNVFLLPFAAQPRMHNPIKRYTRREKLCFAGSYYANRHPARREDLETLLGAAVKYGLDIYDRNFTPEGNSHFAYPEKFRPYIVGSLSYGEIDKAYKGYKIMLNANSVKDSPSMFSRRVFEILACGTPLVSTYAKGIENLFGDLVCMGKTELEFEELIKKLLNNQEFYEKQALRGIREVLTKHSYIHRLSTIADKLNIDLNPYTPRVGVFSFVDSIIDAQNVVENFRRQLYTHKELFLICQTNKLSNEIESLISGSDVHLISIKELDNLHSPELDFWGFFSPYCYYAANYLGDLLNARKYVDSPVIGKAAYFTTMSDGLKLVNGDSEYLYCNNVNHAACIINKSIFTEGKILNFLKTRENFIESLHKLILPEFSMDKYNFIHGFTACSEKLRKKLISSITA